jgi:hypothetical protein
MRNRQPHARAALRMAIVQTVEQSPRPLSTIEIADAIGQSRFAVSVACAALRHYRYLELAGYVKRPYPSKTGMPCYRRGDCRIPLPHGTQLAPAMPVSRPIAPPRKLNSDIPITADDLAWMEHYRQRAAQRAQRRAA